MTTYSEEIRESTLIENTALENSNIKSKLLSLLKNFANIDNLLWAGILLLVFIVPNIVRYIPVLYISPVIGDTIQPTAIVKDVFTIWKYIFLFYGSIILLVLFGYKLFIKKDQLQPSVFNVLLFFFAALILVSCFNAEYVYIAYKGTHKRAMGGLLYCCYAFLFMLSANLTFSKRKLDLLLYTLSFSALFQAIIALLYFYGFDILQVRAFQNFLVPGGGQITFDQGSYFCTPLANPNYASGFGAVLTSIFLGMAVFQNELKVKIIYIVFSAVSFALILASLSTSGFLTMFLIFIIMLFLIIRAESPRKALFTLVTALVIFSGIWGIMYSYNPRVAKESVAFIPKISAELKDTKVSDDPLQKEFNLPAQGRSGGSGRIYIWQETLKLIKEKPLLGYGMDTLVYYFPHNDINKNSGLGGFWGIVDKPHNLYLGIAFGGGLLTLAAFILMAVVYSMKYFKIYLSGINTIEKKYLTVFFLGWTAYLIQGLFNDPRIGSFFVYWLFFGIGVALISQKHISDA